MISRWTLPVVSFLAAMLAGLPVRAHEPPDDTLARIDRAILASPGDAELWRQRALLLRRHRSFARAHADLARAVELGLDPSAAARERGLVLLDEGRSAEAEVALRSARASAPDDPATLLAHARSLAALGRWREAADTYARLVALAPGASPDVHLERVRALEDGGPAVFEEAIGAAEAGLAALGPVPALEQVALALELRAGRLDAALARLERMARAGGRPEGFELQRAGILERAGRRDDARAAYRSALAALETVPPLRRRTPAFEQLAAQARAGVARLEPERTP
jgi:tetratricopeptide (TPR) repeat protein